MWYINIMEYCSAIKKKKDVTLPFATTWIELDHFMLSKISQMEKYIYHMISLLYLKTNRQTKNNEQTKHTNMYIRRTE